MAGATVYRYRLTELVTTPAGEGRASIAGRVHDLIGPGPNRRPGTPARSAPAARQIWQPSDPTNHYALR